jgi:hypothetical protein
VQSNTTNGPLVRVPDHVEQSRITADASGRRRDSLERPRTVGGLVASSGLVLVTVRIESAFLAVRAGVIPLIENTLGGRGQRRRSAVDRSTEALACPRAKRERVAPIHPRHRQLGIEACVHSSLRYERRIPQAVLALAAHVDFRSEELRILALRHLRRVNAERIGRNEPRTRFGGWTRDERGARVARRDAVDACLFVDWVGAVTTERKREPAASKHDGPCGPEDDRASKRHDSLYRSGTFDRLEVGSSCT